MRLRALPEVIAGLPADVHPCVLDAYVNVFFTEGQQARFRDEIAELGRHRDLDWISLDPLVPMGDRPTGGVLGAPLPAGLLERARARACSASSSGSRTGRPSATREVLALGHPGWGVAGVAGVSSSPTAL